MSTAVIDIQGNMDSNNQFIPREIAVYYYSSNHIQHLSKDLHGQWVFNNYRRFTWNGGLIQQHSAINMLRYNLKVIDKIYVKGLVKRKWIIEVLNGVGDGIINLEENYAMPNIHEMKKQYPGELRCNNHNGACALQNVQLLHKIIKNNFSN